MMKRTTVTTFCLFCLVGNSAGQRERDPAQADVTVNLVTSFGQPVDGTAEFWDGRTMVAAVRSRTTARIPYGTYDCSVNILGFETFRRTVIVDDASRRFRFGLLLADIEDRVPLAVAGRVEGQIEDRDLWIRLIGVYSDTVYAERSDTSGFFRFPDVRSGSYFILVTEDDQIVEHKPISITRDSNFVVLKLE